MLVFLPHFLEIVVEVKAMGPPHVLELCQGCKQGHIPCRILLFQQRFSCVSRISCGSLDCHKVEVNLATLSFVGITVFKPVVSAVIM